MDHELRALLRTLSDASLPEERVRLARALDRAGRDDEALEVLRAGLLLRPRDRTLAGELRGRLAARGWKVGAREWTWHTGGTSHGVHTREDQLVWWATPDGPGGPFGEVAGAQSFEQFFRDGPLGPGPPPQVLRELEAFLGHDGTPWLPRREWGWHGPAGRQGVHTHEARELVWFVTSEGPNGRFFGETAVVQPIPEFLAGGPPAGFPGRAPPEVLRELEAYLRGRG